MKIFVQLLCTAVAWFATQTQAAEFECRLAEDIRYVNLDYPGLENLCEVAVTNQEGERKVLWYANVDSNFCSDKIDELVGKYQNQWGFVCTPWPERTTVETLDKPRRKLLDAFIKTLRGDAEKTSPPELISATRAFALNNTPTPELIVQVFLMNQHNDSENRSWHLVGKLGGNDYTAHQLPPLISLISPAPDEGISLESALLEKTYDDNRVVINTTLKTADTPTQSAPDCYGQQTFTFERSGVLVKSSNHGFSCLQ